MKLFTAEQIQEKFDQLPTELQSAITSPAINIAIEDVARKHGLQLDQLSELVDLVGLVMLGLIPSNDFVKEFSRETNINERSSRAVAEDINNEVFSKIRTSMRENEEQGRVATKQQNYTSPNQVIPPQTRMQSFANDSGDSKPDHVIDLERAGGFTIEDESTPIVHEAYKEPLANNLIAGAGTKQAGTIAPIMTNSQAPANLPTADNYEAPRNTQPTPITTASPTPKTQSSPSQNTAQADKPKSNWPDAYREPIN